MDNDPLKTKNTKFCQAKGNTWRVSLVFWVKCDCPRFNIVILSINQNKSKASNMI